MNDTKLQQIKDTLEQERTDFNNEVYPNQLPVYLIQLFKAAIEYNAPVVFQLKFTEIKSILKKKITELTNGEVRKINNTIMHLPLGKFDVTFEKAMKRYEDIQLLIFECNHANAKKENELKIRGNNLMDLAGIGKVKSIITAQA